MASDGFPQVLRGEWTKFRTVRSTALCVLASVLLTVLLSLLTAAGSSTNANDGPRFTDRAHFTHQPLGGDGTITARVLSQQPSNAWAKAGLMIKAGTAAGARYAAIMVTPEHGVRLQAGFDTDVAGGGGPAPRWLRLTRAGNVITGFESADGTSWRQVGSLTVAGLPPTAEVGLFVTSPAELRTEKVAGGSATRGYPTVGTALFGDVSGSALDPQAWTDDNLGESNGSGTRTGDSFTLTGSGDIAGYGIESWTEAGDDDIVANSLGGVQVGLLLVVALGVLFATSEYKTGTIRTTLAASPRRGRVLAAKAIVLGGAVFLAGLIASVAAFLIAQPALRRNGFEPPAYPHPSLTDGPVLRAVIGTALFLTLLAVFSLGVGTIRRRTVGAIVLVLALVVVPQLVASVLSINADLWIHRLTPAAGLAIQQTRQRFDTAIPPWAGLGVLAAYAAGALGLAWWRLRGRDA